MDSEKARDWTLCFICQDHSSNVQLNNPRKKKLYVTHPEKLRELYANIVQNIAEMKELGELPANVVLVGGLGDVLTM